MPSFKVNANDWTNFDLEFKVRRLKENKKDQHFGVVFDTAKGKNQLYCRGGGLILWIPPQKIHEQFGIPFEKPLVSGKDVPWTVFNISVKDNVMTVKVDGKQIGTSDKFLEGVKNIQFYAYGNQIEIDDLRIVAYAADAKKKVTP